MAHVSLEQAKRTTPQDNYCHERRQFGGRSGVIQKSTAVHQTPPFMNILCSPVLRMPQAHAGHLEDHNVLTVVKSVG